MADEFIAKISKNKREEICVQFRTFKGRRGIDLRVFASHDGDMFSTPKGILIKPGLLRRVINALILAEEKAVAEGLLAPAKEQ